MQCLNNRGLNRVLQFDIEFNNKFSLIVSLGRLCHNHKIDLRVAVDTLTMNIFMRQNIGRGITFKILINGSRPISPKLGRDIEE